MESKGVDPEVLRNIFTGNRAAQERKPSFPEGERPTEIEARERIIEEFEGKVVVTKTGPKLHFPDGRDDTPDSATLCYISDKVDTTDDKDIEVFRQGTKEFCTGCLECAYPDRSNRETGGTNAVSSIE